MQLDETFKYIVSNPKVDHFSAIEVRTAYLIINDQSELSASEARRLVYAELVKLVKRGWLKKITSKKKGITNYVKTELFNLDTQVSTPTPTPSTTISNIITVETTSIGSKQELNYRLQDYKNDLLEGFGEAEEYRALRDEFPDMQKELQPKYNCIRESNSRLLGKIKALETLIKTREEQ